MGREAFLEEVWRWKEESGGTIVNQLKRLGASCDWSRERFTMDEGLCQAVLKVFVALHKQGLIYRAKRLVNWDPKFQTAISDLEVVQVEKTGSFKWERGGGGAVRGRQARQGPEQGSRAGTSTTSTIRSRAWPTTPTTPRPTSRSRRRGPRRCWAIPASRCIPRTRRWAT